MLVWEYVGGKGLLFMLLCCISIFPSEETGIYVKTQIEWLSVGQWCVLHMFLHTVVGPEVKARMTSERKKKPHNA